MQNLVVYDDGELELKVSVKEDTVWLTQKQIAEVFGVKKFQSILKTFTKTMN